LSSPLETETLTIYSDQWIYLFSEGCRKAIHPVRCIKATRKAGGEAIDFVCNMDDLNAKEVTEFYKQRWDIEVFFKFLKQELNFSHLVSRNENGIKVMLYATLIAATLLLVYKKKNKLTGYKIMKQRFVQELEQSLVRSFVEMCGGNPKLVDKLLYFNSS
jgi:transposase